MFNRIVETITQSGVWRWVKANNVARNRVIVDIILTWGHVYVVLYLTSFKKMTKIDWRNNHHNLLPSLICGILNSFDRKTESEFIQFCRCSVIVLNRRFSDSSMLLYSRTVVTCANWTLEIDQWVRKVHLQSISWRKPHALRFLAMRCSFYKDAGKGCCSRGNMYG